MESWARDQPSFSSTLLDAIYRSIDEEDGEARSAHHRSSKPRDHCLPISTNTNKQNTANEKKRAFNTTPSCSSESAVRPAGLRPIKTAAPPPSLEKTESKKKATSSGRRFRDMGKAKAPASPGAKLVSFINSLFTTGNRRKAKVRTCSTASSTGVGMKRSVKFDLVSVVVEHKMEELMRRFEAEDEDVGSDSSSDLFELDNLKAAIGSGGRYRTELPVYETTHFRTQGAPSLRPLIM